MSKLLLLSAKPLRRQLIVTAIVPVLLVAGEARADPQFNLGLTIGGAAVDLRGEDPRGAFHLGVRADVLFLRARNRDTALGPYVSVASEAFESLNVGGGIEWLLPASDQLAFVVSGGFFERRAPRFDWEPGSEATLFVGSREYNFGSKYSLGAGVFLQGRYGFAESREADLVLGAQIDLSVFTYPFLLLYGAVHR